MKTNQFFFVSVLGFLSFVQTVDFFKTRLADSPLFLPITGYLLCFSCYRSNYYLQYATWSTTEATSLFIDMYVREI